MHPFPSFKNLHKQYKVFVGQAESFLIIQTLDTLESSSQYFRSKPAGKRNSKDQP